jgi:hypothetical protein
MTRESSSSFEAIGVLEVALVAIGRSDREGHEVTLRNAVAVKIGLEQGRQPGAEYGPWLTPTLATQRSGRAGRR